MASTPAIPTEGTLANGDAGQRELAEYG